MKEADMRALTLIFAAVAVSLPAIAHADALTNDEQIRKALVGNTISGDEDGVIYTEFLSPDGRILGEDRQGRYSGHWMIAGGQMCMRYVERADKESTWDCSKVEVDGAQVTWIADGEKSVSKLTPGNPSRFN
jgi:hypothetical protein